MTNTSSVFRRLLLGADVPQAEIADLPDHLADAALELAAVPRDYRHSRFQALDPDVQNEILAALDDLVAEETTAAAEPPPWPPLRLDEGTSVKPFPLEILPAPARALAESGAESIGCAPDFFAVPMLAVAAGVIGRSAVLLLKPGYAVGTTLWAACVGIPSDGKTPALKPCSEPIHAIDKLLRREHRKVIKQWEVLCAQAFADRQPLPPRPKRPRIDVDDTTMEALNRLLEQNPRGLVMIRDELAAFMTGMNQYKGGRGSDRAIACKLWSGQRIVTDRVGHENQEPICCDDPALSIVGGLTVHGLMDLGAAKGPSDGFVDRYLFSFPDLRAVSAWSDRGVPAKLIRAWADLVLRLWNRPLIVKQHQARPLAIAMSAAAKERWRQRYNAHVAEMNDPEFDPDLRGNWGKMREYAGRFALVLTLLHHAAGDTDPAAVPAIEPQIIDDAWDLADYFKSHALKTHGLLRGAGTRRGRAVTAIIVWLRTQRLDHFSLRDLRQARRWIDDGTLTEALTELAQRGVIRPAAIADPASRNGRPPSPVFHVNPGFLSGFENA